MATEVLAFMAIVMIMFPGLPASVAAEFTVKYRKALKKEMAKK